MKRELLSEPFKAEFLREHRDEREAGIGHRVVIRLRNWAAALSKADKVHHLAFPIRTPG
jgi:hypothetical protein